jgi:hypothetical protein
MPTEILHMPKRSHPGVELMRIDSSANRVCNLTSTPGTTLDVNGTIRATSVSSTGVINGASATVTGQVRAATVSSTGNMVATGSLTGASATVTGQVRGATVSSTGNMVATGSLTGASATVTGQVKGATVSSTGSLTGASATVSGDVQGASASLGAIDGSSLSVSGDVTCATGTIADYIVHAGDANTYFGFVDNDDIVFNTNGSERMRIENTGDIGIGTTNPGKKLDVNGDARVGTFTVTSSQIMPDIGSNSAKLNFVLGRTSGTDTWGNYADNYTFINTYTKLVWDVNGDDLMRLYTEGDLSIDGTYGTSSDYRLKENIQSIDDDYAMSVVRSLDPKSFNWKDKQKDKGTEYGFLAQEVKALYPEMVSTKPGTIPMDQTSYPAQITSDATMEITVSDGSTWTSGDKITVNDNTNHRHTLTIHEIQNSVLSLTAETISSNMVDSNSETYIYGKEVDDFHRMKVSYLDPLMISAIQQLDRRLTALENR